MKLPPLEAGWRRIFLIRHGETEANEKGLVQGSRLDPDLNPRGCSQASALGEFLGYYDIGLVCTSGLKRAQSTALVALGDVTRIKRLTLNELNEMDYGSRWDGLHISKIAHELRDISLKWASGNVQAACPDGGESPDDVLRRVQGGIRTVAQELSWLPANKIGLVVAHNFVNKIFLTHVKTGNLLNFQTMDQSHACLNVVDVNPETDEYRAIHVNIYSHLAHL